MTQEHPITPPDELVYQWKKEASNQHYTVTQSCEYIATQAARWGADRELEACMNYVDNHVSGNRARALREHRRPKPPSLKELNLKHLEVIERDGHYLPEITADLRRAIESLPS